MCQQYAFDHCMYWFSIYLYHWVLTSKFVCSKWVQSATSLHLLVKPNYQIGDLNEFPWKTKKKRKKIWKSTAFFPVMLCIIVLWHNNDLTDSPKFSDAKHTIMCIKTVIKKEGDYWLSATYEACHFTRKTGSFSTTLNSILNRNFNKLFFVDRGGKRRDSF